MTTFSIDIGDVHRTQPHLLADVVELVLFYRHDGVNSLSQADIARIISRSTVPSEEIDYFSDLESSAHSSRLSDVEQGYLDDVWAHLEFRISKFSVFYPFYIDSNVLYPKEAYTDEHMLYVFLLTCSRLRTFPRTYRNKFAAYFTLFSAIAFREILPGHASVKVFDANSDDRREHFGTDLRRALKQLGKDINSCHINEEECLKSSSSGDGGLDIVATLTFNDNAATNITFFGQCAARELDWRKKTLEAHPDTFRPYFSLLTDPMNVVFIPVCYKSTSDQWVNNGDTSGCVLIDRSRFVAVSKFSGLVENVVCKDWWTSFVSDVRDFFVSHQTEFPY